MITLSMPRGLVELPLDDDLGLRSTRVDGLAEDASNALGLDAATVSQATIGLAQQVRACGVRLLGRFAVGGEDEPVLATLLIGTQTLSGGGLTDIAAGTEALLQEITAGRSGAQVGTIDLPCGPSVACITAQEVRLGQGPEAPVVPEYRVEFFVPSPSFDRAVVLEFVTSEASGVPEVARAAADVARSLRFDTEPRGSERERVLSV